MLRLRLVIQPIRDTRHSKPNEIRLLSTYYAEIARIIDIKATQDNNWVLINHELTNSELDPIPNDDDANSGANRLDLIYVGDKTSPIKVAEWDNPPAGFHNQDLHVYCDWSPANPVWAQEDCHLFLFGADPYPEMVEGSSGTFYKGTQVFYALIDFEGLNPFNNQEQQNASREILRWGGYTPEPETTCGGSIFNHDNVFFIHPITKRRCSRYLTGALARGWWTSRAATGRRSSGSHGHRKQEGGLDALLTTQVGMAPMEGDMRTWSQKYGWMRSRATTTYTMLCQTTTSSVAA